MWRSEREYPIPLGCSPGSVHDRRVISATDFADAPGGIASYFAALGAEAQDDRHNGENVICERSLPLREHLISELYDPSAIAAAQERGATQRQIADAVGKSPAWVNRLLKWRESGYDDTPFEPESKARRQRARSVQAPKQRDRKIPVHSRKLLVKTLGMLGSAYDGERSNAASLVEKQRAELGMTWDELVIPANDVKSRAA